MSTTLSSFKTKSPENTKTSLLQIGILITVHFEHVCRFNKSLPEKNENEQILIRIESKFYVLF